MTKPELIGMVHEAAAPAQPKAVTTSVVEALFDSIAEVVKAEQSSRWNGLGTFETRERPALNGRNPQTGKPMKIVASTSVAFRPASALRPSDRRTRRRQAARKRNDSVLSGVVRVKRLGGETS